jgi:conjugative transposon TraK protein
MKIYDEKQFTGLRNLDKAYKMNKSITLAAVISVPILLIVFAVALFKIHKNSLNTLYVLTEDGVSIVERTTVEENRELEAKKHIVRFYKYFLDIDPTEGSIKKSLDGCYHLGGDIIKDMATLYKESGFYNDIIRDNITMRCIINEEDISVDVSTYPYQVLAKGKQFLIRKSNVTAKTFNIKCTLRNLKNRTSQNPHALWIEEIMIMENNPTEFSKQDLKKLYVRYQ